MNEQIKLIAEQAGCAWWEGRGLRDMSRCDLELQKFAELIMKECQMQNVITACSLELDANPFVDQIAEHFGFER